MPKVVINVNYGGFTLSRAAISRLKELGADDLIQTILDEDEWSDGLGDDNYIFCTGVQRDHPLLVQVVEELQSSADRRGNLAVVQIPDGIDWEVVDYDGLEHVAEVHRTWDGKSFSTMEFEADESIKL